MPLFGPTENDVQRAHSLGYDEGSHTTVRQIVDDLAQAGLVLVESGTQSPRFVHELVPKILSRWTDLQRALHFAETRSHSWQEAYHRLSMRLETLQVGDLQQQLKALQTDLYEARAGRATAEAALQREKADRAREVEVLQAEFNRQNKLLVEREAQWQQQQ